jgi:hypothetical protein
VQHGWNAGRVSLSSKASFYNLLSALCILDFTMNLTRAVVTDADGSVNLPTIWTITDPLWCISATTAKIRSQDSLVGQSAHKDMTRVQNALSPMKLDSRPAGLVTRCRAEQYRTMPLPRRTARSRTVHKHSHSSLFQGTFAQGRLVASSLDIS